MITAIVRYKLPPTIGKNECLAHFHKIAPGFAKEKGFIRKQFIWNESGVAGGVYQWETLADAKAFYQGAVARRHSRALRRLSGDRVLRDLRGRRQYRRRGIHRAAGTPGRQERRGLRPTAA